MNFKKLKNEKRKDGKFITFFLIVSFLLVPTISFGKKVKNTKDLDEEKILKILLAPDNYKFQFKKKPDPFKSFIKQVTIKRKRKKKILSPLEEIDISEIKLTGIFDLGKEKVALVEDNRGRGFFIKVGTPIGLNEGKVIAIKDDSIVVEEKVLDFAGRTVTKKIILKLRPAEEKR